MNYKLNFTGDEVNVLLKKIQDVTHTPAQLDKAIDDFFALNEKLYIEENNLMFDQMFTDVNQGSVLVKRNAIEKTTKLFRMYFENIHEQEWHGQPQVDYYKGALKISYESDDYPCGEWNDNPRYLKISLVDCEDGDEENGNPIRFVTPVQIDELHCGQFMTEGGLYGGYVRSSAFGDEDYGNFAWIENDASAYDITAIEYWMGANFAKLAFAVAEGFEVPDGPTIERYWQPTQIRLHNIADPVQPMEGANKRYVDGNFVDLGNNIFTVTDQDIVVDHQRAYKIGQLTFMHLVFHRTSAPSTTDTVKIGTMSLRAQHDHAYAVAGFNSNTNNCIMEAGVLKTNGDVMIHFTKTTATSNVTFDATFFFVANQ